VAFANVSSFERFFRAAASLDVDIPLTKGLKESIHGFDAVAFSDVL
jgi:hypothetical protein